MTHIHWVARQNKLEIPRDKDEVNKRSPPQRWKKKMHPCEGPISEFQVTKIIND